MQIAKEFKIAPSEIRERWTIYDVANVAEAMQLEAYAQHHAHKLANRKR